jgi:hypothetical protein
MDPDPTPDRFFSSVIWDEKKIFLGDPDPTPDRFLSSVTLVTLRMKKKLFFSYFFLNLRYSQAHYLQP